MRRSFSSAGVVEARPETVDRPVPSAASFLRREGNAVFKYFQTRAGTPPDHVQGATTLFDLLVGCRHREARDGRPLLSRAIMMLARVD
jgi:hypothetical protein